MIGQKHYLRRDLVCERLRLGLRQSYRIVGASYGERISSVEVVDLLNRARRAIPEPLTFIPSDLLTAEEVVRDFAASDITERELRAWTHRVKNVCPHFRLNSHTIRFSRSRLNDWLAGRSKIRRHA